VFICSLSSAACNAPAPLLSVAVWLYNISPYILTKARFSKKDYWTWNMCFDLCYKYVWKFSYSKKNWVTYDQKYMLVFM